MLVLDFGVREAARKLQINENTVLDWSRKGNWLKETRPTPAQLPPPASMKPTISPIKPADALANTLADRLKRTKLGLSAWAVESSEHLATLRGEEALLRAPEAKQTADVAGKVWPEQTPQQVGMVLNVSVLSGQAHVEHEIIDISDSVEQASIQDSQD